MQKKSKAKRILIAVGIVVAVLVCGFIWYVNDYYRADDVALAAASDANGAADGVEVRELAGGDLAFVPEDATVGLIFYPGGKVQPEAYAPLMERCAQQGVLCVLVKPLFNLAILDMDAAAGIQEQFPEIGTWLIAGHSLGGVVASDYLSRHSGEFAGIVFLASYPDADLADYGGKALSLIGTVDGVVDRGKYEAANQKLPADAAELAITGGNHAYFGNYGEQAGDGVATITHEEQQAQTVDAIMAMI